MLPHEEHEAFALLRKGNALCDIARDKGITILADEVYEPFVYEGRHLSFMDKLDIIILAGQSNAAGTGTGEVTQPYRADERILMMTDDSNPRFETEGDFVCLKMDLPATNQIAIAEEPADKYSNFSLSFAAKYAQAYLEADRKILIVNAAVNGTGFARPEWGIANVLHHRLIAMVEEALSYNPENRVVAFLWHQGEHDAF